MKFEKILSKPLCIGLLFCAFAYGLVLPFCWGNDPLSEYGTLSILCDDHRIWFWLWGMLTAGSIILNTQYMYKKFGYKNKFLDSLCALGFISMICVASTLGHPVDSWNTQRIIHWIATGLFIVFIIASIALFFLFNIKKYKRFGVLTICIFAILATFLLMFAIIGKSGLMEIIPLAMLQILLFIVNFTPAGNVIPKTKN